MGYVQAIRRVAGTQKIILVYATMILYDEAGRILLQERADLPFWGLPGGVLEWGETVEACARRELREETGLEAGRLRLIGLYSSPAYDVVYPNGDQAQQFTICFAAPVAGGRMCIDRAEVKQQRFVAAKELAAVALPHWYADMIDDWLHCPLPRMDPYPAFPPVTAGGPVWVLPAEMAAVVGSVAAIVTRDETSFCLPPVTVRVGESATETVVRVVAQEFGVAAVPERLLGVASDTAVDRRFDRFRQRVTAWFLIRLPHTVATTAEMKHWLGVVDERRGGSEPPGQLLSLSCLDEGYFVQ